MTENTKSKLSIFVEEISQNRKIRVFFGQRNATFSLILPMNFESLFFDFGHMTHVARLGTEREREREL